MAERFHAGAPGTADAGLRLQGYGLLHRNGGRLSLELLWRIRSANGSTAAADTQREEVDTVLQDMVVLRQIRSVDEVY